jgi:hypothetical protein
MLISREKRGGDMDPRADKGNLCGVSFIGSTGIEWICIKPVHAKLRKRKNGRVELESNPEVDRHYYVNKWPNRPTSQE